MIPIKPNMAIADPIFEGGNARPPENLNRDDGVLIGGGRVSVEGRYVRDDDRKRIHRLLNAL